MWTWWKVHRGQIESSVSALRAQSSKTHSGGTLADGTAVGEGRLDRVKNDQEQNQG